MPPQRPVERIRAFVDAISPKELTVVVDVGANPFAGTPPYGVLRRSDRAKVIGFEPQESALEALVAKKRWNDQFLPYAIGDGSQQNLYVTKNSGLVSTLKPRAEIGKLLGKWWERAIAVKSTIPVQTKRLDAVKEISHIDFLKIDIQGGELSVFQHAKETLKNCAAIQTEVCLHSYYEGQPSFGDIQSELSKQGFMLHKFVEMSAHPIAFDPSLSPDNVPPTQTTVADVIFIKDVTDMNVLADELIKQLAVLSMSVFHSYDLCLRCLSELRQRKLVSDSEVSTAVDCLRLEKRQS